jgi:hypothetical protein
MASSRSSTSTALVVFNTLPRARLNWNDNAVISTTYIAELKKRITNNFPKNADSWMFTGGFPAPDIEKMKSSMYDKNLQLSKNYNPLELPLVEVLSCYGSFYVERVIVDDGEIYGSSTHSIGKNDAIVGYLNFLKQYNLAYIDYLEAINGSTEAIKLLLEKFSTEKMFVTAKIKMNFFHKKYYSTQDFLYGVLAHLSFHILFSKDADISTIARARAFEIIVNHFDLDAISKAFKSHAGKNYDLCRLFGEKIEVYNLIPKAFVTESHETGELPHNKLFFKNKTIANIFKIDANSPYPAKEKLASAIGDIITHYQTYAIHIIHSALRCVSNDSAVFSYLFAALLKLSKLDNIQKETIFGEDACYRHGGENKRNTTAQIDWVMGLSNFGGYLDENELSQLDNEQLKTRIRQQAYRIYKLEAAALNAEKDRILSSLNQHNDPSDYLRRLLMPAEDMPEDDFNELLQRNYRVLAHEYHPDSQTGRGSNTLFLRLREAYEVLADRERRINYMGKASIDHFGRREAVNLLRS